MDSHVRQPPGSRRNANTEHLPGLTSSSADLRQAYSFARSVVRLQPDVLGGQPGHRLVWVDKGGFGSSTLHGRDDAFAIVGRHTQCGVVLPDDPFVALRHLLVRSIALPSGGVALRVLDLHTELGFALPDGTRHTSIFAEGPVAIGVGRYALVALPAEAQGDELPGELPAPQIESSEIAREQIAALEAAMSPYRANARPPNRSSRITLMPRPVMVGEPMPPSLGRLVAGGAWAVSLERGGRSATVTLSAEDLVRGVIIGRSEKCHSELLRRITDIGTSRAHVLILREGDAISAYDLASTQGTYFWGDAARRVTLADSGTLLTLGRGDSEVRLGFRRTG